MKKTIILTLLFTVLFINSSESYIDKDYFYRKKKVKNKVYYDSKRCKTNEIDFSHHKYQQIKFDFSNCKVEASENCYQKTISIKYLQNKTLENNYYLKYPVNVTSVQASFRNPEYFYVDLIPEEPILLPKYTKGIDLWMYGGRYDINLCVYYSSNLGPKHRVKLSPLRFYGWKKDFFNVFQNNLSELPENFHCQIDKIRIEGSLSNDNNYFYLLFSELHVYNYKKTPKNIYHLPYLIIENFETEKIYWKTKSYDKKIVSSTMKTERTSDDSVNPTRCLHLAFDKSITSKREIYIEFPDFGYRLLKGYSINLWIKGNKNNEGISFIINHRGNYLFEVVLGVVDFDGWKKLSVKIPDNIPIQYFVHHYSGLQHLKIIGMKVNPGDNGEIKISIDNLSIYSEELVNIYN